MQVNSQVRLKNANPPIGNYGVVKEIKGDRILVVVWEQSAWYHKDLWEEICPCDISYEFTTGKSMVIYLELNLEDYNFKDLEIPISSLLNPDGYVYLTCNGLTITFTDKVTPIRVRVKALLDRLKEIAK